VRELTARAWPRMDVLRRLREVSDVPVIVVTAHGELEDKILGLDNGADDYIVKPFDVMELVARMRRAMRRRGPDSQADQIYDDGLLRVDFRTGDVHAAGVTLNLTRPEFRLLTLLLRSAGATQSVSTIVHNVWDNSSADVTDRATALNKAKVTVLVARLRQKLNMTDLGGTAIVSARGLGYFYRPPNRPAAPTTQVAAPQIGYSHTSQLLDILNAKDRQPDTGDE
jgi:DNA-binding response OmpR family regulator